MCLDRIEFEDFSDERLQRSDRSNLIRNNLVRDDTGMDERFDLKFRMYFAERKENRVYKCDRKYRNDCSWTRIPNWAVHFKKSVENDLFRARNLKGIWKIGHSRGKELTGRLSHWIPSPRMKSENGRKIILKSFKFVENLKETRGSISRF